MRPQKLILGRVDRILSRYFDAEFPIVANDNEIQTSFPTYNI